jgi:hypothetical protein
VRFNEGGAGRVGPGFVPDRMRDSGCGDGFFLTPGGGSAVVLNCAADNEGLNIFRGVDDPLDGDVSMSSPFMEGPTEEKDDPFWDLLSVEELPDRLRLINFSIASASRSRMRVATGERENVWLAGALSNDGCMGGDATENVLVLPAEEILTDRLKEEGIWKNEVELAECTDGCDGEDDAENDGRLVGACDCELMPSISPLSDVAVVRLVPDPLRIRGIRRMSRAFEGSGGGRLRLSEAHSLPLVAGCAKMRRDFLLFSNCIRAVSCNVSLVLKLDTIAQHIGV